MTVWPLGPAEVVAVLDLVGRDDDLVAAVWLVLPTQRVLSTRRAIRKARVTPRGLVIAQWPASPLTNAVGTLLTLHLALLRERTPTQWRTIDARRQHRTANEAATALGCTHQTVSRSLERAGIKTTRRTLSAFVARLELAAAN